MTENNNYVLVLLEDLLMAVPFSRENYCLAPTRMKFISSIRKHIIFLQMLALLTKPFSIDADNRGYKFNACRGKAISPEDDQSILIEKVQL